MPQARVQSLETLKDVKAAMLEFAETVATVLASVDADINRVSQWLSQERPPYWKAQVRRREDEVNQARMEIARKRLISAPEPASVALEQKAERRAKQQLEEAQQKLANVRRWAPVWERQAMMYKASCQGLNESISSGVPAAAARLEKMMRSLEEYARLAVPTSEGVAVDRPPDSSEAPRDPTAPGEAPPPAQEPGT